MKPLSRIALATALIVAVAPAFAGAREDLQAFTQGLRTLQGGFTQTVYDANGRRKDSSAGRVALSAPRLFRWEYVRPYRQLIVADGRTVWVYDPDLQQVSRRAQGSAEADSPLAALVNPAQLERDYRVADMGEKDGLSWLQLTPKRANAAFRSATIGFQNRQPVRMSVVDAMGQRIEFSFAGWRRNPGLPASDFRFVPPQGVDVVGQ